MGEESENRNLENHPDVSGFSDFVLTLGGPKQLQIRGDARAQGSQGFPWGSFHVLGPVGRKNGVSNKISSLGLKT